MLHKVLNSLPEQIKLPLDISAPLGAGAVWVGYITDGLALITAAASAVWAVLRAYDYIKNRKKK